METRPAPSRRTLIVARFVFGLGGLLFGLVVAELLLRFFLPQPLALSHRNPSGLTVHIPDANVHFIRQEFNLWVKINSLGLRDREFSFEKPPGVFRILVLGDSYPEGVQVPLEETFPKRLETMLAARFPDRKWQVINAGVSGYGTGEEIKLFEELGRRFNPDLVILGVTVGNDLSDNRDTPYYGWRDGKLVERTVPPLTRMQLASAWFKEFASSRFHVVQFLRDRIHTLGVGGVPDPQGMLSGYRVDMLRAEPDAKVTQDWQKTEALLDGLRSDVEKAGARLFLVAIPVRFQVEDQSWTEFQSRAPFPLDRDIPQRHLAAYARDRGLPCIDLLPSLRETGTNEFTYFRIEGHFTAHGHDIAAREILKALEDTQLLPAH